MQLYPLHGCMGSSKGHNTALTGSFLFVAWSIQGKLTVIPSRPMSVWAESRSLFCGPMVAMDTYLFPEG